MNRFGRLSIITLLALLVILETLVACGGETMPADDAPGDEKGGAAPENPATETTTPDGTPAVETHCSVR